PRPVRAAMQEEAAGQAFRQTPLEEQRGGPEDQDLHRCFQSPVLVPKALHLFAPPPDFLDLVEHEEYCPVGLAGFQPSAGPMCLHPLRTWRQWCIGRSEDSRKTEVIRHLGGGRGLPHLPGAHNCLEKIRAHPDPAEYLRDEGSLVANTLRM